MRLIGATDTALRNREDMKKRIGLKTVAELLMLHPGPLLQKDRKGEDRTESAKPSGDTNSQNFKETEQRFLSERKASSISVDCGSDGGDKGSQSGHLLPQPPKATFTSYLRKGIHSPRRREWKIGSWKMVNSFPDPPPVRLRRPKTSKPETVGLRRKTSAHRSKQDQLDFWCQ